MRRVFETNQRLKVFTNRNHGLMCAVLFLIVLPIAACSSSEAVPTAAQTLASPTLEPTSTVEPTSTPVPTPVRRYQIVDIDTYDLKCIDFHPGVFNPEGPSHWYEVSSTLTNKGDSVAEVNAHIEILQRRPEEFTLIGEANRVQIIDAGQTVVLNERLDLEPQANNFFCRVKLTVVGEEDGPEAIGSVDIESIYAP